MKPYSKESREQAHRLRNLRRTGKHLTPLNVENLEQKLFDGMEDLSLTDQLTDGSVVSTCSSTSEDLSCAYGRQLPSLEGGSSIPSSPGSLGSVGSSPLTTRSTSSRSLFSPDNSEYTRDL
ncbi:MAG: hypothetical protein K0U37_09625 [Gammaproteobacteria bacterium]|nr:hypothetical protein [Gammaproteobacteria bacterium]